MTENEIDDKVQAETIDLEADTDKSDGIMHYQNEESSDGSTSAN